jgi:hypothetical protein
VAGLSSRIMQAGCARLAPLRTQPVEIPVLRNWLAGVGRRSCWQWLGRWDGGVGAGGSPGRPADAAAQGATWRAPPRVGGRAAGAARRRRAHTRE